MERILRIFDFNAYNEVDTLKDDESNAYRDKNVFTIQMFGIDQLGKSFSVKVEGFKPFFYVMVNDTWTIEMKDEFIKHLKMKMGKYYSETITKSKLIKRKKLYGFDNKKEHKFIFIEFENLNAFNKAKNFWYSDYQSGAGKMGSHHAAAERRILESPTQREGIRNTGTGTIPEPIPSHVLLKDGYEYNKTNLMLYEANIPPILRYFHITNISPSGWIAIPNKKCVEKKNEDKTVNCDYEIITNLKNIIPLNEKETRVPYKIMSFDIEASSSHGDFPIPIKTYKKLAIDIVEYFEKIGVEQFNRETIKVVLTNIILTAFGYECIREINLVYPKKNPNTKDEVINLCNKWFICKVRNIQRTDEFDKANSLERIFEQMSKEIEQVCENDEENDETSENVIESHEDNIKIYNNNKTNVKEYSNKSATVIDILLDTQFEREGKINELNISLNSIFPKLEGDKVTFIGSTFMNYGNKTPNLNTCIVLNSCSPIDMENTIIESYDTEKKVLMAWQQLVQKENPDIIIGYNMHGFDYEFMFRRSQENNCVEEFLKLGRNKDEICGTKDADGNWKIEESTIHIASGQHDLRFIKMNGRVQIDLYNFYRRNENLSSYKLDSVAGNFIGDFAKKIEYDDNEKSSLIYTGNLTGLLVGSYIHIEEIGNSVDYYDGGTKYIVTEINILNSTFKIDKIINPDKTKKIRWCLAKDDVTPKDIFRLTNGTDDDRAIIAKYCIQDCNLVHYLCNKSDVITGFIEMSKICSVPINYLIMRGQGIKLQSLISCECRKIKTLMPVIEKGDIDEGYEGATVLTPKCGLYLDNPVACNDYASLYPSSMISENLSHDSKVWTKEYDLEGKLIKDFGCKDENGNYIYDNLAGYEYVDVKYDTYIYVRKNPKAAAQKIKNGHKQCRFVQFPDGEFAIMPSILKKLLKARKDTRKMIPNQTDDFMKTVLEQRQLGYKVTANSLYGGCGAKTSSFYDKDIAACTTAIGRKMLVYGKKIIEDCYSDKICDTINYGKVRTRAEYIYGDTDSVFYTFNLEELDGNKIRGKKALEITIELAQQLGELAGKFLKAPHEFEYEKTFMPFCLLSCKRYVGMLYENSIQYCKRKEMGIVLKRRDNAPIVKDVYGGIIDILMKEQSIEKAIHFLQNTLNDIVNEKCPINKLIITKSLRSGYKNPQSIAHKVLADRITTRDPGNKPSSGDRIPFVYIITQGKKLQGDKIETPTFILENKLKIDYSFYITNQIMKPVQQLFALVLEQIWQTQNKLPKLLNYKKALKELQKKYQHEDEDKQLKKIEELRCKEIKALLFDDYLRQTNNLKTGNQTISKFFVKK